MSDNEILLDFHDAVAVFTLNAPERRNAMTPHMAEQFCDALQEATRRPRIGALVVRGSDRAFCAGADVSVLSEAATDPLAAENFRAIGQIYHAFYSLGQVELPTVAAARGWCVGAGLNLLLAADLRIVAADARLRSGFAQRALHPGGGHFHLLTRLAGRETAAAMGLFGADVTGEQAAALRLAWLAVESEQVDSTAIDYAARVAAHPELARRLTLSFREETEALRLSWRAATEFERSSQMWSMRQSGE
jgi:enoyl-CoA hydratase